MRVIVHPDAGGSAFAMNLKANDTVEKAKVKIQEKTGVPARLLWVTRLGNNNDWLRDEDILTLHGVTKEITFLYVLRYRDHE